MMRLAAADASRLPQLHDGRVSLPLVAEFVVRQIPIAETRPLRQKVLRPHQTLDEVAADEPDSGCATGAFVGERLVAVGIIGTGTDPSVWRVRGMATEPLARGRGAGSAILDALVQYAVQRGAVRVWCSARTPAVSLYERAGFRATSEEFERPLIGPHLIMELSIAPG
jgi:GNAT superfamily N-acetyltransferase